jgi:hypothetical protein
MVYGRYLDAVDSMIETEQLETALLWVSPIKTTYFYKQLPRNLPDGLGKNIAATIGGTHPPNDLLFCHPRTDARLHRPQQRHPSHCFPTSMKSFE